MGLRISHRDSGDWSQTALGSAGNNLESFFVCNYLAKFKNLATYFNRPRNHALGHVSSKYYHIKSSHRGFILSQVKQIFCPAT